MKTGAIPSEVQYRIKKKFCRHTSHTEEKEILLIQSHDFAVSLSLGLRRALTHTSSARAPLPRGSFSPSRCRARAIARATLPARPWVLCFRAGTRPRRRRPPKRRWSDTVRRQDLETLRREEQRHREARARLSAAAAAAVDAAAGRAGAARASFPGPRFAGESTFASRRREEAAEFGATEDLLREMRLGAWHRLLSDARRSLEPDPGDGELSVDSSVVSGVAATLADPTRDFFPGADSATFGTPRRETRALDALALERSGGRFPRGQSRGDAETATTEGGARSSETKERKTPRVRVRLEVVNDDERRRRRRRAGKSRRTRTPESFVTARALCASSRRRAAGARRRRRRRPRRVHRAGGTERRART